MKKLFTLLFFGLSILNVLHACNPTISPSYDQICKGDMTILTASGGVTYKWSTGATTNSINVGPLVTTRYYVVIQPCADTLYCTVTIDTAHITSFTAAYDTVCNAQTTNILTGIPSGGTFSGNGVSGNNFNPSIAGAGIDTVYYYYADPVTGCSTSKPIVIDVNVCSGIDEISENNVISLYPNPNNGEFILSLSKTPAKAAEVEIYNMMGQNVYKGSIDNTTQKISVNNNPAGVYLYRILNRNNEPDIIGKFTVH